MRGASLGLYVFVLLCAIAIARVCRAANTLSIRLTFIHFCLFGVGFGEHNFISFFLCVHMSTTGPVMIMSGFLGHRPADRFLSFTGLSLVSGEILKPNEVKWRSQPLRFVPGLIEYAFLIPDMFSKYKWKMWTCPSWVLEETPLRILKLIEALVTYAWLNAYKVATPISGPSSNLRKSWEVKFSAHSRYEEACDALQ